MVVCWSEARSVRSPGNRHDRLILPLLHGGSQAFTKRMFGIKARVEGFVRSFQEVNQKHHLPILNLTDSHLDFRDLASTDVPTRFLKLFSESRLRPAATTPDPPHLPANNILVIHAGGRDSKIAPARRAAEKLAYLVGEHFPGSRKTESSFSARWRNAGIHFGLQPSPCLSGSPLVVTL